MQPESPKRSALGMATLKRPEAVVFDMDGLIFDTETLYEEAILIEAKAWGLDVIDHAFVRSTVGLSWPATRDLLGRILPHDMDVDAFKSKWVERYDQLAAVRLATKPGVRELLDILDDMDIPCAIATGSNRITVTNHLAGHGLLDRFKVIISGEDCSNGKPAPEPFLRASKGLGIAPVCCLALEDSVNGARAALSAGMTTIVIPDLVEPDAETAARCAFVLRDLLEVCTLLRSPT